MFKVISMLPLALYANDHVELDLIIKNKGTKEPITDLVSLATVSMDLNSWN
jgi:hypothetical protein